jgi:hypothetical protein
MACAVSQWSLMDPTVLWVRWLVAGLSSSRPGFNPRAVLMRFVVDEVALGQIVLPLLWFSPSLSFHQCCILIFMCGSNYTISVIDNISTRDNLVSIVTQFGVWTLVRAVLSAPIQIGPEAHLASWASCTFRTRSLSQVEGGWCVGHTTYPLSSTEVKERVELYLIPHPISSSWPMIGWTLL